jgi:hypothetical protein
VLIINAPFASILQKTFKDRVTLEIYGLKLEHWATPDNMGASKKTFVAMVIK